MGKHLENSSFESWIKYVFDHPVKKRAWYWSDKADYWSPESKPEVTVAYITQAFENPLETFASTYTDAQLNQGLWFLLDNSCSDHMFALKNEKVPLAARIRALTAMAVVFEQVFLPRCSGNLQYLDEKLDRSNPLDAVCYMWWDILPIHGATAGPDTIPTANAILEVMEKALGLESDACRESALHGLGHWHYYDPERIESTVERFLKQHQDLRPELITYAKRARKGHVL